MQGLLANVYAADLIRRAERRERHLDRSKAAHVTDWVGSACPECVAHWDVSLSTACASVGIERGVQTLRENLAAYHERAHRDDEGALSP